MGLLNRNRLANGSVQYLIYQILILGVIYYFSLEGTSGPQCRIRVCNLKLFYVILVVLVAILSNIDELVIPVINKKNCFQNTGS